MAVVRRVEMTGFRVDHGSDGVVYLSGELDMATVGGFVQSVMAFVDHHGELVLDAAELEFIDSTGIGGLLELAGMVRPTPLIVRSPQPNVAKVLQIVNIEALGIRVEPRSPHSI
jgi:anti-anti-sigma factor